MGSLRRFAPDVGDVTLLGVAPVSRVGHVLRAFARLPVVAEVTATGPASVTTKTTRGDVTLHLTSPEQAGAALVWHTGSRAHVDELRARAQRLGLRFSDATMSRVGAGGAEFALESDVYTALGLPFIAPELRNGGDEIAAAERGELPDLLAEEHIRGDLHTHSTWSDGRNTIADMVSAGKQLGYEYLAITDHSERAWSSRKLAAADVGRQREEIETLRSRVRGIEIFHGIEVDIMPDGSLDFDDEILEGFDIVLASLHDAADQDNAQLTERYLRAIRHPLVNVITHPANRSPAVSAGYPLDFDRLFAAAAETGTAMEVDGAPGPPRHGRSAGAQRGGGGGHHCGRQRLPSRGSAQSPDALRRRHGAPRLARAGPRAQHAERERRASVHRTEARAWLTPRRTFVIHTC